MATYARCINCFVPSRGRRRCPVCGFDTDSYIERLTSLKPLTSLNNNRYLVGKVIGQGGFGITYVAWDQQSQSRCAIKEYFPSKYADRQEGTSQVVPNTLEDAKRIFRNGCKTYIDEYNRIQKFVRNPLIVNVLDHFNENGTAYIVMEYIEGKTLQVIQKEQGRVAPAVAMDMFLQLGSALSDVHKHDIMHRDLKPANIILTNDGEYKLIDFGSARDYIAGEEMHKGFSVYVTPGFSPPEQYERIGKQGPWTDVYSLCATFYYLVSGKKPEDARKASQLDERIPTLTELNCDVPREISDIIQKGMELDYRQRYQSFEPVLNDLFALMPKQPDPPQPKPKANDDAPLPAGTMLAGHRYRIERMLGRGGSAITYLVKDNVRNRLCALKEYFPASYAVRQADGYQVLPLNTEHARNVFRHGEKEFRNEAGILLKLASDPLVVNVETPFAKFGTYYIPMEYVEGQTLQQYMEQRQERDKSEVAADMIRLVGSSLQTMHSQHILHRDINPANIFYTNDGTFRLIDFGSAILQDEVQKASEKTVFCTPGFSPPEQYQRNGDLGPWSDVYALCATYYYLVSGQKPGDAKELFGARGQIPSLSQLRGDISDEISSVIQKGMALDYKARYHSIKSLLDAFENALEKQKSQDAPISEIDPDPPKSLPPVLRVRTGTDRKRVGFISPPVRHVETPNNRGIQRPSKKVPSFGASGGGGVKRPVSAAGNEQRPQSGISKNKYEISRSRVSIRSWDVLPPIYKNENIPPRSQWDKGAYLLVLSGEKEGKRIPVLIGQELLIGREREKCQLVFEKESRVSRRHCAVSYDAKKNVFFILDLSTNGTYLVKGRFKLPHNQYYQILPGERFYIGSPDNVILADVL